MKLLVRSKHAEWTSLLGSSICMYKSSNVTINRFFLHILYLVAICSFLQIGLSCQDDIEQCHHSKDQKQTLKINAKIIDDYNNQTKNIITGTQFPDNSKIGVTVVDESGRAYDGRKISNLPYTFSSGIWTGQDINLSSVKGKVYAYFPYNESEQDITSISVDATKMIDYLYTTTTNEVSNTSSLVSLGMSHVLTAISVKFVKGIYDKPGNITHLTCCSSSAAKNATFNAITGDFTDIQGESDFIDSGIAPITLDEESEHVFFVIPTGKTSDLLFKTMIDGHVFEAIDYSVKLLPGKKYNYTLTINYPELSVSSVKVTGWSIQTCEEYIPELI